MPSVIDWTYSIWRLGLFLFFFIQVFGTNEKTLTVTDAMNVFPTGALVAPVVQ